MTKMIIETKPYKVTLRSQ